MTRIQIRSKRLFKTGIVLLGAVILLFLPFLKLKHRIENGASPGIDSEASCQMKYVQYYPSLIEKSWSSQISNLKTDEPEWKQGCAKVDAEKFELRNMMEELQNHAKTRTQFRSNSLSRFLYEDSCTGAHHSVYIEPLVSFLRHPLTICVEGSFLDKSYLLLPYAQELPSNHPRKWLFDAGASTYNTGPGGASQSWFVDRYKARGIEFDRILGWEAKPTEPREQWGNIPADIKQKTSWYNIPITTEIGGDDNPLTFIKALTKKEDYVVFKLDIDNTKIETEIVRQIMEDPELWVLIDEFYFEHHVRGSPMQWHGWGNLSHLTTTPFSDIQDSYDIFGFLRAKGIRAHSWV